MNTPTLPVLTGTAVTLRPITDADTDLIVKWRNTPSVVQNFIFRQTFTPEMHRSWLATKVATGQVVQYIILDNADGKPVGSVYYRDIDNHNRSAEYGIFIGETLKIADKLKLPRVTLGVMIGKAVKLAEGHLDTHSKKVTMNKEFIQDIAHRTGCNEDVLTAIRNMNLARELWDIIPAEKLETFSKLLTEHCKQCCAPLLPDGELTILLISEDGKIYV